MAYKLTLTEQDVRDIGFIGGRYSWSNNLRGLDAGEHEFSEARAWDYVQAVDEDDGLFPMLDQQSELFDKLWKLYTEVV